MSDSKRMTVISLAVDSFKRIRAARVEPSESGLVYVRGENGQGKSSLLDSMASALGGKKSSPRQPIQEGRHAAETVVDLGSIVVRERWTRDGTGEAKRALTVEDADGTPRRAPQSVLDDLAGRFADPVAFLSMSPEKQVRTVLDVLGLTDKLGEIEKRRKAWYDKRRDLGRELKTLEGAEAGLRAEVEQVMPNGITVVDADDSIEDLAVELEDAERRNQERQEFQDTVDQIVREGQAAAAYIDELEKKLVEARAEHARLSKQYPLAKQQLDSVPPVDTGPIIQRMKVAESTAQLRSLRERWGKAREETEQKRLEHEDAEKHLESTRAMHAALLDSTEFPVEGMSYDAETQSITINGIAFDAASQAERLRAAAAIAMAGDPEIGVLFAREGSLLDAKSQLMLHEMAMERGFQLFLEVVDSPVFDPETGEEVSRASGIWIEDGEAIVVADDNGEGVTP